MENSEDHAELYKKYETKTNVRVSIVTVCFNSEKTIERTLKSVLDQYYKNIEYIIIDGLSSDRTVEICRSYEDKFKEAGIDYYIYSEKDSGIYDAMNKGVSKATGDIVGIINSDDIYEKDAAYMMAEAYDRENFDLAFANIRMILPSGKTFIKKARVRKYTTSRDWNHPTQFVKRSIYDEYRYKCENISDDMDFYFRVKKAGKKIIALDAVLADFTMGGVSSSIPIKEVPERIERRYKIYRQNGYSRFYFFECAAFEVIKYIGAKF